MGLFNKILSSSKPTVEEKLATGELNWKLKSIIYATKDFPNYLTFISKIEKENNIQFGLTSDVSNETINQLILRQAIYNKNGNVCFHFSIYFQFIKQFNEISFMAYISEFNNTVELLRPIEKYTAQIFTNKKEDLDVSDYEKYYWELFNQSFSLRGLNPYEYSIKGEKCVYRLMEENFRSKYK